MNRDARRYLLGILNDNPIVVATVPEQTRSAGALETLLRILDVRGSFVLPMGAELKFLKSGPRVRVVAGKGKRRRGVRGRVPPLRVVRYP